MEYSRKLFSEEVAEGYVFIDKKKWSFFLSPNQTFGVCIGEVCHIAKIEAKDCTCVGEDKPHLHHHLILPIVKAKFKKGDSITITKKEDGTYNLVKK